MFSHVVLGANDLEKSKSFYDALLGTLGVQPGVRIDGERYLYMQDGKIFIVTRPIDGEAASHANGGTIGFGTTGPEQVDAWHAAGVASGGTSCEDPPGYRDSPAGKLYLAYLRDPDGNKLCAMYRAAQ